MPDVFISHSSKDAELADRLCAILEENGIECWMAPRNIMPGDDWASAITKAIKSSKAFLIIYSENSVNSTQVPKEIMLAGGNGSYIIPYRIDDTPLIENYEYHLGTSHWIQADIAKGVFKGEELVEAVNRGIGQTTVNVHISVENTAPIHIVTQKKPNKLVPILIGVAVVLLVAVFIAIVMLVSGSEDSEKNDGSGSKATVENSGGATDKDSSSGGDDSDNGDSSEVVEPDYVSAPVDVDAYDSKNVTVYKDGHGEFFVQGKAYNYGYVMYRIDSFMTINVSDYSQVTFSIARTDDSDDAENKLYVSLDGEEYDYFEVYTDKISSDITIDLTDVDVMRMYVDGNGAMCDVAVFDVKFTKAASGGADNTPSDDEVNDAPTEGVLSSPVDFDAFDSGKVTIYKDNHDSFTVQGKAYNYGYVFDNMGGRLMFNTEGITQIKFSAGRLDGSSDEENKVFIYIDGIEYDWYSVSADGVTKDITIDLDGENHIVRIFTEGNGVSSQVCIFDMTVTKTSEPEPTVIPEGTTASPDKIEPYFSTRTTVYNEKSPAFTVNGTGVSQGYVFECYEAGALFNVYGFNSVTMTVGRNDGSNYEERKVYFYVDGYEVECITIEPDMYAKQVEIDLHGSSKTLYIFSEGNVNSPELAIYDMYFEGEKQLMSEVKMPDNAVNVPDDIKADISGEITAYNGKGDKFAVSGEMIEVGYVTSKYYTQTISLDVNGHDKLCFNVGVADEKDDYMLRFRQFTIYLDGEEVATYNIGTAAGIQTIEVDVTGAKKVEIVTAEGNVEKADLAFFNMYLS